MTDRDIVELARSREQDCEGCELTHDEWLIKCMADEIERLRAEVLEQCRLNGMGGSREAKLRAEVEQQRLELGITEDACGMLESEVKQLRARVAELEAALDHYSGGASEALLRGALESISNGEGCGGLAETERLQEIARLALMKPGALPE